MHAQTVKMITCLLLVKSIRTDISACFSLYNDVGLCSLCMFQNFSVKSVSPEKRCVRLCDSFFPLDVSAHKLVSVAHLSLSLI